jgi:hypothetical protein
MSGRQVKVNKSVIARSRRVGKSTYYQPVVLNAVHGFVYSPFYIVVDDKLAVNSLINGFYYIPEDIADYVDGIEPKRTLKEWLNQPEVKRFYFLKYIKELK